MESLLSKVKKYIGLMFIQYEIKIAKQSISMIDNDKLLYVTKQRFTPAEKIGILLNFDIELSIHVTRLAAAIVLLIMFSKKTTVEDLNTYMQQKVKEGFAKRFEAKNIEIMRALEALDASK